MVFPGDRLGLTVELALGADPAGDPAEWTWTDITQYVRYEDRVQITTGRADESSVVGPSSLSLTLDNRDGRFTRLNPLSPYYGRLRKNTPIRVIVDADPWGPSQRFGGFITEIPNSWGSAGRDSYVEISASGPFRRLEAADLVRSPMRIFHTNQSPLAYWPLEDEAGSTVGASLVDGVGPMRQAVYPPANGAMPEVLFGEVDGAAGSYTTPEFPQGFLSLDGAVPPTSPSEWTVTALVRNEGSADTLSSYPLVIRCDSDSGSFGYFRVELREGTLGLWAYDEDDNSLGGASASVDASQYYAFDGRWHCITAYAEQVGTSVHFALHFDDLVIDQVLPTRMLSGVIQVSAMDYRNYHLDVDSRSVSHIAVYDGLWNYSETHPNQALIDAMSGHSGERAVDRMVRLCAQESVRIEVDPAPEPSERLGAQPIATLLDILRDAAAADRGVLYETLDYGVGYIPRSALYGKATGPAIVLDSNTQYSQGIEVLDDDQSIVNDATITRKGGIAARAVNEDSVSAIGRYQTSETVNVYDDDRPAHVAGWVVYQGSQDPYRYPGIGMQFARSPELIPDWISGGIGSRLLITDVPSGLPPEPIDVIIQGYQEAISPRTWGVLANTSASSAWIAATLDDDDYGRLDTSGSQLMNDVDSDDAVFRVVTTHGPEWVNTQENPGEFPFDIRVGGELVTVTGIESGLMDMFDRTVSDGWGTASTGQVWETSGGSPSDYYTNGSQAVHSLAAVNSPINSVLPTGAAQYDVSANFIVPIIPTGNSVSVSLLTLWNNANNYYGVTVMVDTDSRIRLRIDKRVSGSFSQLSITPKLPSIVHTADTVYGVRFKVLNGFLYGKVWDSADPEPRQWTSAAYDTSLGGIGYVGFRSATVAGNTNTYPVLVLFDNITSRNIQDFTVTRSANTVEKSHASGDLVRVANPVPYAL